jgi:iron-sulfur cluster repair protein YtfE (RIC family)
MPDDVVDKIEHDHREVEQLFQEFRSSGDRAVALRVCDELEIHTIAEEERVYPVLPDGAGEGDQIAEAEDEHEEARQLIERIRETKDETALRALMTELETAVQHHVKEEETEVLPKVREELPSEELQELGEEFEEAKEELQ